jgi:hypothetical protein
VYPREGRFRRARSKFNRAKETASQDSDPWSRDAWHVASLYFVETLIASGGHAEAAYLLFDLVAECERHGKAGIASCAYLLQARLFVEQGDLSRAEAACGQARRCLEGVAERDAAAAHRGPIDMTEASLLLSRGDPGRALTLLAGARKSVAPSDWLALRARA